MRKRKGHREVTLNWNCLNVVNSLKRSSDITYVGNVIRDYLELMCSFDIISIRHSKRSANHIAYTLAKTYGSQSGLSEGNSRHESDGLLCGNQHPSSC